MSSRFLEEASVRRVETQHGSSYRLCKRKGCDNPATVKVEADCRTRSQNIRMKHIGRYCPEHATEVVAKLRKGPPA